MVANPLKVPKEIYALAASVHNANDLLPPLDYHSAVILMAHDLQRDSANLKAALASEAGYIGILGPKKRSDKMLDKLATNEDTMRLKHIFAPVGLDTGATSPEEIAVAMIAEIRAYYSGRVGGFLRDRQGPIND